MSLPGKPHRNTHSRRIGRVGGLMPHGASKNGQHQCQRSTLLRRQACLWGNAQRHKSGRRSQFGEHIQIVLGHKLRGAIHQNRPAPAPKAALLGNPVIADRRDDHSPPDSRHLSPNKLPFLSTLLAVQPLRMATARSNKLPRIRSDDKVVRRGRGCFKCNPDPDRANQRILLLSLVEVGPLFTSPRNLIQPSLKTGSPRRSFPRRGL